MQNNLINLEMFGELFLKCCGLTSETTLFQAKHKMFWGTYGKPSTFPVRWIRLIDCTTNHLNNIIKTQHQIPQVSRYIIHSILSDRNHEM